jgi:hypothetical protein
MLSEERAVETEARVEEMRQSPEHHLVVGAMDFT